MTIHVNKERFTETMREQAAIGRVGDSGLDRLTPTDADEAVRDC